MYSDFGHAVWAAIRDHVNAYYNLFCENKKRAWWLKDAAEVVSTGVREGVAPIRACSAFVQRSPHERAPRQAPV